jgi:hypothetical protein
MSSDFEFGIPNLELRMPCVEKDSEFGIPNFGLRVQRIPNLRFGAASPGGSNSKS